MQEPMEEPMEEPRGRSFGVWDVLIYFASVIAVVTFMLHFWWPLSTLSLVLWFVAGGFAILSTYGGVIERSRIADATRKGRATASAVIGVVVLIGLAWSATLILVPLSLSRGG